MTAITQANGSFADPLCAPPVAQVRQGTRRYIYCIIDGDCPAGLGMPGIDGCSEVFAIPFEGTAALVSATDSEKLEISRGAAIGHQRVMEAAMKLGHTVLPVRFNTLAEPAGDKSAEKRLIDHVLAGRRDEILGLLTRMKPLVELGVKGLWPDMEAAFRQIAESSPEILALRKKLMGGAGPGQARKGPVNLTAQVKLGEMVKKALGARKGVMEAALLSAVGPLAADVKINKTFGDPMFANLALLVERSRQVEVEKVLTAFEAAQPSPIKLRCVGPLPACNFLELVITWDD
jgi:hypothetical protein